MSVPMSPEYLLYYLPLMVSVALVLAATRHERTDLIIKQAISQTIWFTVFMLIVAGLLWGAMLFI